MAAKRSNHKPRQDEPVRVRKRWPTKYDLLSWWTHYKICSVPMHDLDDPDAIKQWFLEFVQMTEMGVHVELYANCPEFRIEFKSPRDSTYGSEGVGIGRSHG
jgi:hypothetical protein